jgi:glycosyltransferase involved in cell wall biosynthesis
MAEQSLRILQVSTSDKQGGAEGVAWNLFTEYRKRGHDSKMAVGVKRSDDPDVIMIPNEESRKSWVRFFRTLSMRLQMETRETPLSRLAGILAEPIRRFGYFRGVEDFHFPGTARLLELNGQLPDILHLHNLHGAYFDLRRLPQLSRQVPLLLTLHDAWLFSGHCAHSFGCEKWKTGCGHCPDLTIYPSVERDATAYNWNRKRDIFLRSRLYASTPSRWLMQKLEASILAPAVIDARVVPNSVDLDMFHGADQPEARSRLGISQNARVLLAAGVRARQSIWRDFQMLEEAVTRASYGLEGQELLLIVLGEDAPPEMYGSAHVRFVPFEQDIAEVAGYYQAADIYLHPARVDTFPSTVLESLACGTPVIATAVGGIPEQIEDARTGFLVQGGDAEGMAIRIIQLLCDDDLRRTMRQEAALHARQRFGLDRQIETYLDWYHELAGAFLSHQ